MLTLSQSLFQLDADDPLAAVLDTALEPWVWLAHIGQYIETLGRSTDCQLLPQGCTGGLEVLGPVWMAPGVTLPPYGSLQGPCYLGPQTQLRPGVLIRGHVISGKGCVLGHACEYKNAILLNDVQTPHYNYVGDSVLGSCSHLAAGAILANLRLDEQPVWASTPQGRVDTGRRKCGSFLGDEAQVGCNAVLQPGTVLGRGAVVFPLVAFAGYLPPGERARRPGRLG
jgi:acetyltransferase-like isoleucine patch superfamily enzyme